jgi:hypothetical protein
VTHQRVCGALPIERAPLPFRQPSRW